jgi:SAM-dependent methyltransferase
MERRGHLSREEQREALRHDDLFRHTGRAYVLGERDWQKFDSVPNPTHGYVYSVQRLGDLEGKTVLDLGCGTGWFSVILAKRGAQVEGVDISGEAIRIAREMARVNDVEDRVRFRVGSAYDLEHPDNHFDMVAGQAILHHLRDKAAVAAAIHRVLKPGARAVFFEAFGNSRFLGRLRLVLPLPVNEVDRTHWTEQLTYQDLAAFHGRFSIHYREFQLLSRLDRLVRAELFVEGLGKIDVALLRWFPYLRRYARTVVVELTKRDSADLGATVV